MVKVKEPIGTGTCTECGRPFLIPRNVTGRSEAKRKKTCSPSCHAKRARKLAAIGNAEKRKPAPTTLHCEVCNKPFIPYRMNLRHPAKYCKNPACKEEGIRRAVQRQTERRMAAKKIKEGASS